MKHGKYNISTGVYTVEEIEATVASNEQLAIESEVAWATLREQRDNLLTATDYYALSDVTMSPEMAEYRQALRDLPSTVDINNPIYPTKPIGG